MTLNKVFDAAFCSTVNSILSRLPPVPDAVGCRVLKLRLTLVYFEPRELRRPIRAWLSWCKRQEPPNSKTSLPQQQPASKTTTLTKFCRLSPTLLKSQTVNVRANPNHSRCLLLAQNMVSYCKFPANTYLKANMLLDRGIK